MLSNQFDFRSHRIRCLFATVLFLLAVAFPRPAQAQLSLLLQPDTKDGVLGSLVSFNARLTNLSPGSTLYLNGIAFNVASPDDAYMTPDDTPFFFDVPFSLSSLDYPSDVYEGHLFDVQLAAVIPLSQLQGQVTILGGYDPNSFDDLATTTFKINPKAAGSQIPEPATGLLLMGSFPLIGLARRKASR